MASLTDSIERDLRSIVRGDIEFDPVSRRVYATDAGLYEIQPLGVVSPLDSQDVVSLVVYAAERGLSLVPRGMGSGLNGAAVGSGIQVDFTRYMDSILEMAPDASWVRVQPGVVLTTLNRYLKQYGVFFPPDPSSENHCSVGGMIGTNASGARTVAYGATKDHVLSLDLVLADGSRFEARPLALDGTHLTALLTGRTIAGRAFAAVLPDLQSARETISAHMPRVVKNSCGYRIESILATEHSSGGYVPAPASSPAEASAPKATGGAEVAHLQRLFVGAEGTLGLVTEATLNLVPLPARQGIAMAYFPSVFASGEAVPGILALSPTALEIMDSRFLDLVRRHDSRVDAMLPDRTDTALLIEFEGTDEDELDEKFAALHGHLDKTEALRLVRPQTVAETDHLWWIRRSALSLAQRTPGPRRALPFIEDVTVHPTEVPRYLDFLQRLFDREDVDATMVGHVGDGNIHTRPMLDPKNPADRLKMQRLWDEVSAYIQSVRGSMAGEHGDGLALTPHLRRMYGDEIYDLFSRIKGAFDPQGILNPGKKIGPQEVQGHFFRHVRYGLGYRTFPQKPILHFPPGSYEAEIEKCHGCGQCKGALATTMCPTYKATRREHASPRAKANLLRAIITGSLNPQGSYGQKAVKAVTDYCIECGMCAVECPSGVNIPKLMLEAKAKYRATRVAKPAERLLAHTEWVARLGQRTAPLTNRLMKRPLLRRLAEPLMGIDHRRVMVPFAPTTFAQMTSARAKDATPSDVLSVTVSDFHGPSSIGPSHELPLTQVSTVAYFCDLFANYNDPELALTVEKVLSAHGVRLVLPRLRASGISEMLYGYASAARKIADYNVRAVLPHILEGAVLVSAEPTASFTLKVHYPDYLNSSDCSLVANATRDLGEFLLRHRLDHPSNAPTAIPPPGRWAAPLLVGYHQPCHLKAQEIGSPGLQLLREIPGVEVIDLAAGCCGMAGTFGMKTGTYEFSLEVGRPLFDRVLEAAPDIIASECSTCRMQLAQVTGIEAVHPINLLAPAYAL